MNILRQWTGSAGVALTAVLMCVFSQPALSQPFEVIEPEVEAGEIELEVIGAYQTGFPEEDDDDDEENVRHAHEVAVGYGVTDFLKIEAGLVFEQEVEENLRATNVEVSATLEILEQEETGFGLALYAGIEPSIHDESTNGFEIGPVIGFEAGPVEFTVNTFFEETFGRNKEEGTGFEYAVQAKIELEENLGVGVELFGEVENIGDPDPASEQEHRIGPVVYYETEVGDDQELSVDLGLLFGMTRSTPNVAIKWNVELEF